MDMISGHTITVTISPIEVMALKKLCLINRALAQSLDDPGAKRAQETLMRVLVDVTGRLDLAVSR